MVSPAVDQITASAVSVFVLQLIKKSKAIPWISSETPKLNRAIALILAGITALGIHYTYDATAGTLVISGLTLGGVLHASWHYLQSIAVQEGFYQAAVNKGVKP